MSAVPVEYALVVQNESSATYKLVRGKNVVGRSAGPVEGVAFVNIESPLAAISRMQAFVDIADNGDAWISDCNSTNGTFLAIRDGAGLQLEPKRYYQLAPGCRIVFGDVECRFVELGEEAELPPRSATPSPHRPASSVGRKTTVARSGAVVPAVDKCESKHDVPYLEDLNDTPARPLQSSKEPSSAKKVPSPVKRKGATDGGDKKEENAPAKKSRKEAAPAASAAKQAGDLRVCLSGMDEPDRVAAVKRIKQLGGKIVDSIQKATLLVVSAPPTRTPKFIIAAANRIPIVSSAYIYSDKASLEDAAHHIVALHTGKHTYSSALLRGVIFRHDPTPLLQSLQFNVSELGKAAKPVAVEIIESCGGKVVKNKRGPGKVLTDASLDSLYDSILRGKPDRK